MTDRRNDTTAAITANDDGLPEHTNEVSLAASYYHLFRTRQKQQPQSSVTSRVAQHQQESTDFWEEDEWTPEETLEAEQLLEASRERCSIRSNGLSGRHHDNNNKGDAQAWNKFYSSHQTNFFKDRHYLLKAFPDEFGGNGPALLLDGDGDDAKDNYNDNSLIGGGDQIQTRRKRTLVEIGCGVGNALLPFLEDDDNCDNQKEDNTSIKSHREYQWTVHGLDLSKVAIDWLRQDKRFLRAAKEDRAMAYVCDISALPVTTNENNNNTNENNTAQSDPLTIAEGCRGVADVSTLLFCLSAIAPGPGMIQAVKNAAATLLPGTGVLVFRDYGRFDEAQMKLGTSRNKQLDEANFYRKHDGTKCYYFTLEDVRELFEQHAGLEVVELKYLRRIYRNRGTNEVRRRVWVQGRFRHRGQSGA